MSESELITQSELNKVFVCADCNLCVNDPCQFNCGCPVCGSMRAYREVVEGHTAKARQEGGTHYKEMGVEPWDVIDTWSVEQQIGYHRGNALKYIMRMGSKD